MRHATIPIPGSRLTTHNFDTLRDRIRAFSAARDLHRFHSRKNLAAALFVESAKLLEHFQWLTEEQSCNLTDE